MLPFLAANIDAVCQLFVGAYMCWFAYVRQGLADPNGIAETSADERPPWHRTILLIAGPTLVTFALILLMSRAPAFVGPPTWERYSSEDGTVSIRLPFEPLRKVRKQLDAEQSVTILACEPGRLPVGYALTWVPLEEVVSPEAAPARLETLKRTYEQSGNEIVSASLIPLDGLPAFEIEMILPGGKVRSKARIVDVGRTIYTALASPSDFAGQEADLARFFESFRIDRKPAD